MNDPTQSAMEQQQREAFEAWTLADPGLPLDRVVSGARYSSFHTEYAWLGWQAHAKQNASELRSLRMTSPTTAAMDLARSALREQAERIRVLEARIAEMAPLLRDAADFADSVHDGEWPYHPFTRDELVDRLRAALNKEKP